MCPRTEVDEFLPVFHPMRDRHETRDPEIASDIEHPQAAPGFGELVLQVTAIRTVELAQAVLRPLHAVVPPDRVGVAFDELEEPLPDRLLERVAGGAAVGVRMVLVVPAAIEKIEQTRRQVFETLVAQRPHRRPFDLRGWIEWRGRWRDFVTIAPLLMSAVLGVAE